MMNLMPVSALGMIVVLTVLPARGQPEPDRLEAAQANLAKAMALISAAQAPKVNAALFEKHRSRAQLLCEQANRQLELARRATLLPPVTAP